MSDTDKLAPAYYASSYMHWDFVLRLGLGYLEGCATGYVVRWRGKGEGARDLRKALHFLNKLDEQAERARQIDGRVKDVDVSAELRRFTTANSLSDLEAAFVRQLSTWRDVDDLAAARTTLFSLLDEAEDVDEGCLSTSAVPLTEENHYSEREGD